MPERLFAVMPAAGCGHRMGAELPKQYLRIHGRCLIEYSLAALRDAAQLQRVVLALAPDDSHWPTLACSGDPLLRTVPGGEERAHSVRNALDALSDEAGEADWVLVHDAARPCLESASVRRLMEKLDGDMVGGLLALPIHDTVKQADSEGHVRATPDRTWLWRAQTPQMFRYGLLRRSLSQALDEGRTITDEASALEAFGFRPRLVMGAERNLKVTTPADLALAEWYLQHPEEMPA